MKNLTAIGQLLTGIGLIAMAATLFISLPLVSRYLDQQARHYCAQAHRSQFTDSTTDTVIFSTIEAAYQDCLEEYGVE